MKLVRSGPKTLPAAATHAVRSVLIRWKKVSRIYKFILIAGCSLAIGIGVWFATNHTSTPVDDRTTSSAPEFQTVLPVRTTIDELGGWQRVSPSDSAPTYAYFDRIDGVRISVSQQLLPDNFMENTEQRVKDLADGFSATTELPLEGGDRLYIGTSARGPQSAIVIKNGLLILIKSEDTINDAAWKRYAASLE